MPFEFLMDISILYFKTLRQWLHYALPCDTLVGASNILGEALAVLSKNIISCDLLSIWYCVLYWRVMKLWQKWIM